MSTLNDSEKLYFEHTGGYIKLDSARNQKIAFKIRDNLSTAFSAARISMRYF